MMRPGKLLTPKLDFVFGIGLQSTLAGDSLPLDSVRVGETLLYLGASADKPVPGLETISYKFLLGGQIYFRPSSSYEFVEKHFEVLE